MMGKRVLLAYLPVIHSGILDWLVEEPNSTIFPLGRSYISEYPVLEHDLRRVEPKKIVMMLTGLGRQARVLGPVTLKNLKLAQATFVMPADEVMIRFAGNHLQGDRTEFRNVFIHWDKVSATVPVSVNPDLVVTKEDWAQRIMGLCFEQAKLSSDWWRHVGAAVARKGKVVLLGVNRGNPTDYSADIDGDIRRVFTWGERVEVCGTTHAEAQVVATAAQKGIALKGLDFFTTDLPCPACARLLAATGIKRLFYAKGYSVSDAFQIMKEADIQIIQVM